MSARDERVTHETLRIQRSAPEVLDVGTLPRKNGGDERRRVVPFDEKLSDSDAG